MAPRLKTWLRNLSWTAFILVAAIIIARTAWVCSHTPGGWRLLREHLAAGLPPVFLKDELPYPQRWYQAKLRLLEEADRLAANPNATAADNMAMAWLLCGTQTRTQPDPAIVGEMIWRARQPTQLWNDETQLYRTMFERAQTFAAKATTLEPGHVDWWRNRALLMNSTSRWGVPAALDAQGLEEGLARDPENALYDYLLAAEKMNRAFAQKKTAEGPTRYIADEALFELGKKQYEAAAAKQAVLFGEGSYGCVANLLQKLDAPLELKFVWNNFEGFESATEDISNRFVYPLKSANSDELPQADRDALSQWFMDRSAWMQQLKISSPTHWLHVRNSNAWIRKLSLTRWAQLSAEENWREDLSKTFSISGVAAAALAVMFLLLSLLSWIYLKRFGNSVKPTVTTGFISAPLIFAVALGISFFVFGFAAAYQPELQRYPRTIGAAIFVLATCFAAIIIYLGRFAWRQAKLPVAQRSKRLQPLRLFLVAVISLVGVIAFFSAVDYKFRGVMRDFLLKFPANVVPGHGIDFIQLQSLGATWQPSLLYAGLEFARKGIFWTAGLTFVSLLLLQWRRGKELSTNRERWENSLRFAGKSALWLATLLMLVSLAASSQAIGELSERYERDLARLGDYAWLAKELDAQANAPKPLTP